MFCGKLGRVATLVVDCGGLGLKAALFDDVGNQLGERLRVPTPYPLPPARLCDAIASLGEQLTSSFRDPALRLHRPQDDVIEQTLVLPKQGVYSMTVGENAATRPNGPNYPAIERVVVGMPGMIRRGRVVYTPHYINVAGPHTEVVPALAEQWAGCDIESLISQRLGVPAKVMNDAELHGLGVITGRGCELVLTLGTGLGTAWFDDGVLAPHLELSHAPVRIGEMILGLGRKPNLTYDQFIGDHELQRLGPDHWSDRVLSVVDSLQPVFQWDHLYLGGGNAANIAPWAVARLPANVTIVPNESALTGGLKAFQ